jgi:surface protein
MFEGAIKFDQDISSWKTGKVTDMQCMFKNCPIKEENKPTFKQ